MKFEIDPIRSEIWAIRAGKKSEAHKLFLDNALIALEGSDMGDLRKLPGNRQAFYDEYQKNHNDESRKVIKGIGGKFYRFVHETQIDDIVLYLCSANRQIYVGNIVSEYIFSLIPDPKFPHQKKVDWKYYFHKSIPSELARRELGAARTFFKVKNHAKEIKTIIDGRKATKINKVSEL